MIPNSLQEHTLRLAHEEHPGETVIKRRLRAKVWWPSMDRQVERFVKSCEACMLVSRPNKPPAVVRHEFPEAPWQCIALDLMKAATLSEEILAVIDYYSRYQEIKFLKSTTSGAVIAVLKEMFSRLGIPESIRSDNSKTAYG